MMGGQTMGPANKGKQEQIAKLAGSYAMRKIAPLQRALLGANNAGSARARATLARLRRLNSASTGSWFSVGEELFEGWPSGELKELGASSFDKEKLANAVEGALGAYALHQQSSTNKCAVVRAEGEAAEAFYARRKDASFAHACRKIEPSLDEASGVQRRLKSIEAASDFDGVLYGIRGLVRLMKSARDGAAIRVDYEGLARDLYFVQLSDEAKDRVFARWSQDYFE